MVPKRLACAGAVMVAVAAATSVAIPTAAAAALPEPDLHYAFDADDLTSGVVTDSSGHGWDGALVNGSTATLVDGADGSPALGLPGGAPTSTGAYVRIPRAILDGATDLTVSARIRWDGTTAPWQWVYALGKDTSRYLFSTPYNGNGLLRTAVTTGGGGGEAQVTGYAPLPANAWRTLTVTLDTTADRVTTYLDGAAVASAATTVTASQMLDTATFAGYLGKSFYQDPLFDGAVDDFRVYRAALTAEQVAESVGGQVPQPVTLAQTSFDVRTTTGTAPALPAGVRATFTDGYDRDAPVTWSTVDPGDYAAPGTFTVTGTAAGQQVRATVTVVREGQLIVDLAQDTGDFHGGAAGTLYGLYGQGVPTNNLIEGMNLRTVSTKAQDGPQHPGADALEVVKPLADSTNGDVYIYMTDIHRGFPYQWPGSTPAEKMALYKQKIATQVDQVLQLAPEYRDNVVFVPFNEPEGNMFGTGEWSYNRVSWLNNPTDYFAAWDDVYRLIRAKMPEARISGPNTSVLYDQVRGFLTHTRDAGTLPDVITWHELSHPEQVRTSVARYRSWERELLPGTTLPINVNEYAFNYHTSVPGQMIQWVSAIEESKVDADMAYWNIDGNLSDSAVQANRGNGQWWLFNAYGSMSGHTVKVTPPFPGQNYSMQAVATLDPAKKQARAIFGGSTGRGFVQFDNVPATVFGKRVHAWVREIPWTGQIGDSGPPRLIAEKNLEVKDGRVVFDFGGDLPRIQESSAYEIVLTPAGEGKATGVTPKLWEGSYEAEDAAHTGNGYSRNGPEGSPSDVSKFYTSGRYNVGGLRTGSNVTLDFTVDVPQDGTYDLSVFANSLNTYNLVREQGPTNVFLRVDGAAEQELYLPLGYKWVVWDHTDTTVTLTKGQHTITLAAQSLDGTRGTKGDAIVDRLTLSLPNPKARTASYEAELSWLDGGRLVYDQRKASGSGAAELGKGDTATFWVYSAADAESTIKVDALGGQARLSVNGQDVGRADKAAVSLSGGINKVTVTGTARRTLVDRLTVTPTTGTLKQTSYEAENAQRAGTAEVVALSQASGDAAVRGIGGAPGNGNTLTFQVRAGESGVHAVRIRYANPEQSEATHYNPDPLARHADIAVNGGAPERVSFPHSFHENNFWEQTVYLRLRKGTNTISFRSEELPDFDGTTYASDVWPGVLLRSDEAPVIDRITVVPFARER